MINYFRKFIPIFNTVASPLYELFLSNTHFIWDNNCESDFEILKLITYSKTTLVQPDYLKLLVLFTDGSNYSLGSCLAQPTAGVLKPLGYF